MTSQDCMEWSGHLVLVLVFLLCWAFLHVPSTAGLKQEAHPFLMISPPLCHLPCYLWVFKTCLVSLDVRAFPLVMVIPGWQELSKTHQKRKFPLVLHVVFFGVWLSWCEPAWLDANGMWRNVVISESDWKGLVCQLWAACRADGSMLGFTGFSSQACLHCGYFLISSPVFRSIVLTWWIHHCWPWGRWWPLAGSMTAACVLNRGHLESPLPRFFQRRRWSVI